MYIVVGLGNPGEEYQRTRHNVGWMALDTLREQRTEGKEQKWKIDKRANAEILKMKLEDGDIVLVKPQTFMNNSGVSVRTICNLQTKISNLVVVHDEIDLDFGTIRVSHSSAAAGHRGVQSIIDHLGTKAFWRVRIGIRRENKEQRVTSAKINTPDFVLKPFSKEDQKRLPLVLEKAAEIIAEMIKKTPTVKTTHIA